MPNSFFKMKNPSQIISNIIPLTVNTDFSKLKRRLKNLSTTNQDQIKCLSPLPDSYLSPKRNLSFKMKTPKVGDEDI